jgi:predicted GTPase
MIKYFQVKDKSKRTAEVYYREKPNSRSNHCLKELYISKRKSVLITGNENSGKSHNLRKIWDKRGNIWTKKKAIFFDAIQPLNQWLEQDFTYTDKKGLKQWQMINELKIYSKKNKPIIFIDNADKLTARKLYIAKSCANGNVVYATAKAENRIPETIRETLTHNGLKFNLGTKAAMDYTQGLIILVSITAFLFGFTEIGVLIGVLAMLKGR